MTAHPHQHWHSCPTALVVGTKALNHKNCQMSRCTPPWRETCPENVVKICNNQAFISSVRIVREYSTFSFSTNILENYCHNKKFDLGFPTMTPNLDQMLSLIDISIGISNITLHFCHILVAKLHGSNMISWLATWFVDDTNVRTIQPFFGSFSK